MTRLVHRRGARLFAAALLAVASPSLRVAAQGAPGPGDAVVIRATVQGQLAAFRPGDAVAAHGFAAPGIHRSFPGADTILSMVRRACLPVYRPRQVEFGFLETRNGIVV